MFFFWNSMKFHSAYLNHFKNTMLLQAFFADSSRRLHLLCLRLTCQPSMWTMPWPRRPPEFLCHKTMHVFWKLHCMFFIKWLRKLFFSVNLMGFWCPLSFQHSLRAKQLASGCSGQPVDLTLSYFGNKSLQYLTHEMIQIQMIFWSEADMIIQAPKDSWNGVDWTLLVGMLARHMSMSSWPQRPQL